MKDRIPRTTLCPMTTTRKGRKYIATVTRGKGTSLQGENSGVKLEIKAGCPRRAYLMEVRTDLSNFGSIIPDDECFISPIVEVLAPAETSTSSYILTIPHCQDEYDDRTKVKVRIIHENGSPAVIHVPTGPIKTNGAVFFKIVPRFIEVHTSHFCKVICTICQTPYHCLRRIVTFFYAKFETQKRKIGVKRNVNGSPKQITQSQHDVEIRPYFCGIIHDLDDFRHVSKC